MVTEQEARDMNTAILLFQAVDATADRAQFDADKAVAVTWFGTLGIDVVGATTRTQAIRNYNDIEIQIGTQTDKFRLLVLREKLYETNEKFKEIKRNV